MLEHAHALTGNYDNDSATTVWLRVRDEATAAGDSIIHATSLQNLAIVYRRLGDYAKARAIGEAAVRVQRQHGFADMLPRTFNLLGLVAWDVGRFSDAVALFDTTEMLAAEVGDERYLGAAAGNRGLVYLEFGEIDRARNELGRQLEVGRAIGDSDVEGTALLNLGTVELWVGGYRRAMAYLDSASVAYGGNKPFDQVFLLRLWAFAHDAIGEYQLALVRLDSALVLARAFDMPDEEARNLAALGDVFAALGDLRRALDLHHQAATLFEDLGADDDLAESWIRQAKLHATMGGEGRAETLAVQALAVHEAAGALFSAFDDAVLLAELAARRGDRRVAQTMLDKAATLNGQTPSRSGTTELALARARVARAFEDHEGVLQAILPDTVAFIETRLHDEREAFTMVSSSSLKLNRVDDAIAFAERAVSSADRLEAGILAGDLRATAGMGKREAYHALFDALLVAGRHEAAYAAMSQAIGGRSGRLRTTMARSPRVESLARRLNALDTSIVNSRLAENPDAVESLERERATLRGEFERLVTTHADDIDDRTIFASVPEPGDVVLSVFTAGDHVHIFAHASDTVLHVGRVVPEAELIERARLFRDLVADPDAPASLSHPLGSWLYDLVLRPVVERLSVDRMYVVATGALSYVPFAALWDQFSRTYAGHSFAIGMLTSPSDYRPEGGAMQVAHATLLAPLPDELTHTPAEVEAIVGLIGGSALVGASASEAAMRRALLEDDVVHVATHGVMNARNPLFTRIDLGRAGGVGLDGKLEVHEVFGLPIVSRLVFLAGCETGVGAAWATTFRGGDDYRTLAEAFLQSGAGAVVATLWPIDDAGATVFVEAFYAALREEPPARALATAKRSMMSHDRYSHPFYWAGYRITTGGAVESQNQVAVSVSR